MFNWWVAALHLLALQTTSRALLLAVSRSSYAARRHINTSSTRLSLRGPQSHLPRSPSWSSASCHRAQQLVRRSHSGPCWPLRTSRARLGSQAPTGTVTSSSRLPPGEGTSGLNPCWLSRISLRWFVLLESLFIRWYYSFSGSKHPLPVATLKASCRCRVDFREGWWRQTRFSHVRLNSKIYLV